MNKFNFINTRTSIGFLLFLCLVFTFSPIVSAATDTSTVSDVFQVNDMIQYTKPCVNNGTWCSGAAACTYTFYNRDNTITFNNVAATNVGSGSASLWQYNLTHTSTGLYKVDMACTDGSSYGYETLYYEVTGTGDANNLGFFITILLISFGVVILGLSLSDPTLTIFGSFGLYFVSIYTLMNGIGGVKDATTTWAIGLILLGIAMYISIRSAYELIVD